MAPRMRDRRCYWGPMETFFEGLSTESFPVGKIWMKLTEWKTHEVVEPYRKGLGKGVSYSQNNKSFLPFCARIQVSASGKVAVSIPYVVGGQFSRLSLFQPCTL